MKRVTASSKPPPRKPKLKHKTKSKEKRFDPLQYLNALIDQIQDHSQSTVRKRTRSSAKRQLASAMAKTIPHTERSIGCSKVRSKSSNSQPRRKSLNVRDPLKINLNIVTQQDNIQFTQSTIRESQNPLSRYEVVPVVALTRPAAARKIQRAWRNYQTLKVVRKYFQFYQTIMKQQKRLKELESNTKVQQPQTIKKELEHRLKIRRQKNGDKTAEKSSKPIFRALDFSEGNSREHTRSIEFFMNDLQTLQLPLLRETESREQTASKQLQIIVDLFRSTHQAASKQIEQQFDSLYKAPYPIVHSLELRGGEVEQASSFIRDEERSLLDMEGLSPLIFEQMEATVRQKYELYKTKAEDQWGSDERRRMLDQLEGRFLRQMRAIDRCRQQYLESVQQLKESMLKMKNDQAEVNKIYPSFHKVRKSYSADTLLMKSILEEVSFKNMDLDISKEEIPFELDLDFRRKKRMVEKVPLAVPTSPPSVTFNNHIESAGKSQASLTCFQVDSDCKLREALLQCSDQSEGSSTFKQQAQEVIRVIKQFEEQSGSELGRCSSTSSVMMSAEDNECRQGEHSRMIRQCSEQIQQAIQSSLLEEIVLHIYSSTKLWSSFKSLVQTPFSFKPQTDKDILHFLQHELPKYYGSQLQLVQRLNQKINPTTLEILRLIRDFQFQIEEYDLVLPEEVFKSYRKHLEEKYAPLIQKEKEKEILVDCKLPEEIRQIVVERGNEKKNKTAKFLGFQRDLKIMYLKAVFNCYNEIIIELKSTRTHMNCRSSIGPGELTLALKEYNMIFSGAEAVELMAEARDTINEIVKEKCIIPQFKSHREIQIFQRQISEIIRKELGETEYKWVNYMDEVLEMWQELVQDLYEQLLGEAAEEIHLLLI